MTSGGGSHHPRASCASLLTYAPEWVDEEVIPIGALAKGRIDGFLDEGGKEWDQAPAMLIILEAEGRFYDPNGGTRTDLT